MKKKIVCLLTVFIIIFISLSPIVQNMSESASTGFTITASAEGETEDSDDEDRGIFQGIWDALKSLVTAIGRLFYTEENTAVPVIRPLMEFFLNLVGGQFNSVMEKITNDNLLGSAGINKTVSAVNYSLIPFAAGFWGIFAAIDINKTIRRDEEISSRRLYGTMLIGLIRILFVFLSMQLCKAIIYINAGMVNVISQNLPSADDLFSSEAFDEGFLGEGSHLGIVIGFIVDIIAGLLQLLPTIIALVVFIIILLCVSVKLEMRKIEANVMLSVSSLFFACAMSESGNEYFKRYIMTFISVVMQTTFMAITLCIGLSWFGSEMVELFQGTMSISEYFGNWFVLIALGICLLKPPSVLQNLVKG